MTQVQQLQEAISKGKAKWLQDFLAENLPFLDLPSTDYHSWFNDFIRTLESRKLSKPSQQKNYLTDVRNAIKVLDPSHPALEVIKFSRETWVEINEADRDRIADRKTKLINNPDAIVDQATELISGSNWSDIAAGLAVLTGRRCGEIIKTAQFQYKTKYSVTFQGALKRRNEKRELIFEIPVLTEADLVLKAIKTLRLQLGDEVKTLSINQINQRYEERVAKKCERHFSALVPGRDDKDNLYSHLFRAVYATIASFWYCPPSIPEMEYRAAIQGHYKLLNEKDNKLRRSLAASRHYFDYKISDGSGNIDGRLGIKLGLPGVKIIEQFQPTDNQVKSQSKLTMNEQSNSVNEAVVSLQLSLSRLEAISKILNLSQTETINTLADWAEAGASLAQYLGIEQPTPEALTTYVKELDQNYTNLSNNPQPIPSEPISSPQSGSNSQGDQQQILNTVSSLSNSVELLTKALIEGKSYAQEPSLNHSHHPIASNSFPTTASNAAKSNPQTNSNNLDKQDNQQKTRRTSSDTRQRDSPEVMAEDVNRAIDAILEFNDAPNRPHRQKFRLSIKPVADLSGRATNSVSKILKERAEEIEEHHQKHKMSSYHNKSRRDENGNDYPPIESEPEINYQKITEIAPAD